MRQKVSETFPMRSAENRRTRAERAIMNLLKAADAAMCDLK